MQTKKHEKGKDLRSRCRNNISIARVKYFIKKVHKYLSCNLISGEIRSSCGTKSGHFSVVTCGNGESKKFLVGLRLLSHPPFVRLLEAAEREFGFEQKGVLSLPCEASELLQMLSHV